MKILKDFVRNKENGTYNDYGDIFDFIKKEWVTSMTSSYWKSNKNATIISEEKAYELINK